MLQSDSNSLSNHILHNWVELGVTFAKAILRAVIETNTEQAWLKLFMLQKPVGGKSQFIFAPDLSIHNDWFGQ